MRKSLEQWFEEHSVQEFLERFENYCKGQYRAIFVACGADRAIESLDGNHKHVACPRHEGRTSTNYRVIERTIEGGSAPFDDYAIGVCNTCLSHQGLGHLAWYFNISMKETRKMVKDAMGWTWGEILGDPLLDADLSPEQVQAQKKRAQDHQRKLEKERKVREEQDRKRAIKWNKWIDSQLKDLFSTCITLNNPRALPARKYYQSRGIPDITRFSSELVKTVRYTERYQVVIGKVDFGYWRAIVSKITNPAGEVLNVHAIIIDEDGRPVKPHVEIDGVRHEAESAKLKSPAKRYVQSEGRAIRPFESDLIQAVCEGQEVGMSAKYFDDLPVDMAADANGVEAWLPRSNTKLVFILVDNDKPSPNHPKQGGNGVSSGFKLQQKLANMGIVGVICFPDFEIPEGSKSVDWNDVYANFQGSCSPYAVAHWKQLEETLRKNCGGKVTTEVLEHFGIPEDYIIYQQYDQMPA